MNLPMSLRRKRRPLPTRARRAPLVADFDRVWGNRAPRGREILEIVQEMGPSTA
jgi:hypothetical protein